MTTVQAVQGLLSDFSAFSRVCYPGRSLRRYQLAAARPILDAVSRRQGGSTTVLFSRQAGKDELLAQLVAFLLARYRWLERSIVMAAPTFKPQALISRRRLIARTATALHAGAHGTDGYRYVVGQASVAFLSADGEANVRGETADALLIANEAQDIVCPVWDARFSPMTASTHAPSVYAGTPWATGSLLSREMARAARFASLYKADWQEVAAELPAYGDHVRERIAQLGANHPFIQSEYCLVELDAAGGLFDAQRQAQMHGTHTRQHAATPGHVYAMLLDVAGADEDQPDELTARAREKRRDSTALTVVEVDLSTVQDDLIRRPSYRVVDRKEWIGEKHSALLPQLLDLARNVWGARYFVVDATGIGAGLSSLLLAALAPRCTVLPYTFSLQSKSALGWAFLGCIESGRFKDYRPDVSRETQGFWQQVGACGFSVDPGPGKVMRWAVPDARGHDDLLLSAALVGALDELDWRPRVAVGRTRKDWGD